MTTDFEGDLRELFREKAGEAPLATPADPPRHVLRRGRLHQVGTVLGSGALAAFLIVGSVAGLQRILGDGPEPFEAGRYEVFERTATIEAFTVTSPSDWYLVNPWPSSMQLAVGSGSGSQTCTIDPEGNETCTEVEEDVVGDQLARLPEGLPMLQLSNTDLGLQANPCATGIPADTAVLYVAVDARRAIEGIADPSIPPFPADPGLPPEGDGPCGPGRYARFTVNEGPFFAWIGVGSDVSAEDRDTVHRAYEGLSADRAWQGVQPAHDTSAYVIAGGATSSGSDWRLELRPSSLNVELTLEGIIPGGGTSGFTVPETSVDACCQDQNGFWPVAFGAVRRGATGVELRPSDEGDAIRGTILPLPPTIPFDFDLFFIEGTSGMAGEVVALGIEQASPNPPPGSVDRADVVRLSGAMFGQSWTARFTGAFADRSACIGVRIGEPSGEADEPLCLSRDLGTSLAGTRPSLHLFATEEVAVFAGAVTPEVVDIRFTNDDGTAPPMELQCTTGPRGWTDPDRNVCAIALPPEGSGTLTYVGAGGEVLFEDGFGWGSAVGSPVPADLVPEDPS